MTLNTAAITSPVKGVLTAIYTGKCACCGELYAFVEQHPSDKLELSIEQDKYGNCFECDQGDYPYPH